jgi:hypothetical protein
MGKAAYVAVGVGCCFQLVVWGFFQGDQRVVSLWSGSTDVIELALDGPLSAGLGVLDDETMASVVAAAGVWHAL